MPVSCHLLCRNTLFRTGLFGISSTPTPQGGYQGQVLQHDVIVQESLSLAEEPPLLLGEGHRHVLKGHMALSRDHKSCCYHGNLRQEWYSRGRVSSFLERTQPMKSHGLFGAYSPFNFFCNLYKSVSSPIVTHPSCNSPNGPGPGPAARRLP